MIMLATIGPLNMNPVRIPSFFEGHFFVEGFIGDQTAFLIPMHCYAVAEKIIEI